MRPDEYIPIDSVNDLDPAKISLGDINKRYMDRNGMRYATRFNLKTRKVEIVRIVKGRQEAEIVRRQIIKEKSDDSRQLEESKQYSNDSDGLAGETVLADSMSSNEDFVVSPKGPPSTLDASAGFVERQFMDECASDFEKVKERLTGITNFIKNSRYFEAKRSGELTEVFRGIDVEGIQRSEHAINYYKELMSYPRPVSYYIARLGPELKERLDSLENDEQKMVLVRRLETQATFHEAYSKVAEATKHLLGLLDEIGADELDLLPHAQRQAFEDARAASRFLIENCTSKLEKIKIWKHKYGG